MAQPDGVSAEVSDANTTQAGGNQGAESSAQGELPNGHHALGHSLDNRDADGKLAGVVSEHESGQGQKSGKVASINGSAALLRNISLDAGQDGPSVDEVRKVLKTAVVASQSSHDSQQLAKWVQRNGNLSVALHHVWQVADEIPLSEQSAGGESHAAVNDSRGSSSGSSGASSSRAPQRVREMREGFTYVGRMEVGATCYTLSGVSLLGCNLDTNSGA